MNNFDLKQWLFENKVGAYGKASLLNEFDSKDGFSDEIENRDDMNEVNSAVLGVGQAVADAEMEKQDDDERGDMLNNASMGVVAEAGESSTEVQIEEWEVTILGKDYIIYADVDVDFHYEQDDYVDHMITSPGGYFIDSAVATITKLGVFEGDDYRYITDPAYIKQIQDLINKDPKLNRELEDTAADYIEWDSVDDIDTYEGPDINETVGYVMKTKPSDPLERGE